MGCCGGKADEKYWFQPQERQDRLKGILESWLRTPFRHHCGVKGMGCDCIHFVARVFEEVGYFDQPLKIEWYPKDWHLHRNEQRLMNGLAKHIRKLKSVPLSNFKNGDVILFQYGRTNSHVAIYFDGHLYQALARGGVHKTWLNDPTWMRRMRVAFRVVE